MKVGPSPEYMRLLRGEINSKEYVTAMKRRLAQLRRDLT